ncbi:MAG: ScyD/ScyE family protein, partial [Ardenticatenaceae bacterium]
MRKTIQLTLFSLCLLILLAALLLFVAPPQAATAEGAFEVLATQLNQPRHIAFGPDGTLYVAEAGSGGDTCINPDPKNPEYMACIGLTGGLTSVTTDGTQERIADLYSIAHFFDPAAPPETAGPHDVAIASSGEMYVLIGLGADPALRDLFSGGEGQNLGQLAHVMSDGTWMNMVDVAAYEAAENPDGSLVDSNPYALHLTGDDSALAADAGGNTLLNVPFDAAITTHTVFPPGSGGWESVPTSIAEDSAGNYYVGELTGFPYPPGMANVYHVMEGMDPMVHESGFTNIGDIAYDEDGNLYVLELSKNGLLSGDITGAIIRVAPDGTRTTLVSRPCDMANLTGRELCFPTGLTVGADGMLYVSNFGVFGAAPPPAPSGQVIRIPPTEPTAVTLGELSASSTRALSAMLALAT